MRNDEKREDSVGEIARLNSLLEQRTAENKTLKANIEMHWREHARLKVALEQSRRQKEALEGKFLDAHGIIELGCLNELTICPIMDERDTLKAELAANAKMLARQCDLARQAENERDEASKQLRLANIDQANTEAELAKKSAEKEVVEERLRKVLLRLDFAREE